MSFIKLVENTYLGSESLLNLLSYILSPQKINEDSKRAIHNQESLGGCIPFWFPSYLSSDALSVYLMMNLIIKSLRPDVQNLANHRIISFPADYYILPSDAFELGQLISEYYAKLGFVAAYGVHCDTYQVHIHIAVCRVNYTNGTLFHNYYELDNLHSIVNSWAKQHESHIDSDPDLKERYEKLLFGNSLGFSAKDQLCDNRFRKLKG